MPDSSDPLGRAWRRPWSACRTYRGPRAALVLRGRAPLSGRRHRGADWEHGGLEVRLRGGVERSVEPTTLSGGQSELLGANMAMLRLMALFGNLPARHGKRAQFNGGGTLDVLNPARWRSWQTADGRQLRRVASCKELHRGWGPGRRC
ncbi:hypothetical protein NDU88_000549 [Pleurodeles waltl]|uniref:Uncharacterized protein n=1 Tax=Pleurodeles waltl TaxID=8319 RepID=A0AAV7SX02_PLEWA|nr:hypothetical protein NDU88_000549 [Pleurodeles waltl]